jgi:hypothetical protein
VAVISIIPSQLFLLLTVLASRRVLAFRRCSCFSPLFLLFAVVLASGVGPGFSPDIQDKQKNGL